MDNFVGFFISFFQLIFGNLFAFIAFYLLILVNIKLFGIWKIQFNKSSPVCPKCASKSSRINREKIDKVKTFE